VRPPFLALVLLSLLSSIAGSAASARDFYHWTQFTADGLEARAVVEDGTCPEATIDGRPAKMTVRAGATSGFPVTVCRLGIPAGAKTATIKGRPAPLPPARVDRILILGDTGCRINILKAQACNDLARWPFRLVADLAAERAPDLVVHLGDLIYRERPCPDPAQGCAGSPSGDDFETWKADWFDPARALLEAAPIVFVRGNHEDCARNGAGWTRFASAFAFSEACTAQEPPFTLDLGGLALAVLDVTRAEDRVVDPALASLFEEQFKALSGRGAPLWIAMHKPIYGALRIKDGIVEGDNKTLVAAARDGLPSGVEAMLSGHLHLFEALSYKQDFPAQIVAGIGGTLPDPIAPQRLDGLAIADKTIATGVSVSGKFGFATLERSEGGWLLQDFDTHGALLARCTLAGRTLACN